MGPRFAPHNAESATDCSDIRELDHSKTRRDTPALPFCHLVLTIKKPKDSRYPTEIKTLGDQLKARRLDLGLYQKDVAVIIGVTEDTVCYWENNRVTPSRCLLPRLQQFIDQQVCETV